MHISDTVHFQLDTDEGMQEFANLVPPSGHLVYVRSDASSEPQPYAVTLFHQMTCLDVVRQEFTQLPSSPAPQLVRHCMNYLRQTVLCRPSLFLESTVNSQALVSRAGYDVVCRDWNAVYEEAERNYAAYVDWSQEISNRR
ncbi:hypothetical protein PHLCEN_2v11902 [Hermanssonia centrifuga]|uniref:Uncharacterized protein n=1 Tax=Hermanssonia centrifuga TaxID=98765 RepID=A0A2R6NIL3_9APHY|nr:hypothetical protein PHLCEN_2v11902 [Hermanssonia centrifuga]